MSERPFATGEEQGTLQANQHPITIRNGRMVLPLPLQQPFPSIMLGRAFAATVGIDPLVAIYPIDEWEIIEYELMRLPSIHNHVRRLQRLLIGNAVKVQQSEDGTIYLPPHLTHYAQIRNKAAGLLFANKIELWNPQQLRLHVSTLSDDDRLELKKTLENTQLQPYLSAATVPTGPPPVE